MIGVRRGARLTELQFAHIDVARCVVSVGTLPGEGLRV